MTAPTPPAAGTPPASSSTPPASSTPPSSSDPEAGRIKGLDERFGKLESEQREQRGMLEQILGKVSGSQSPPAAGNSGGAPGGVGAATGAPSHDVAELMRQAVRDVGAERAAARQRTDAERARIEQQARAEHAPREQTGRGRKRLQRALWGIVDDDKRPGR